MARLPTTRLFRREVTEEQRATALLLGGFNSAPSGSSSVYALEVRDLDRAVDAALALGANRIRVETIGDFDCEDGHGAYCSAGAPVKSWGRKWAVVNFDGRTTKAIPQKGAGFFVVYYWTTI